MKNQKLTVPVGASLIVLSSIFYASYGIWTRLMGDFFGSFMASALRSVVVLLMLIPAVLISRKWMPINWRRDGKLLLGLTVTTSFIGGFLYYAILHAGIGISLGINYAAIVIGSFIIGSWFANERFTSDKALSACIGIFGILLVFWSSLGHVGWLPLLAVIASGLASSVYNYLAKRLPYTTTQSTVLVWAASAIGNIAIAVIANEAFPDIGWHRQWLYLVAFAATSVVASYLFMKGIKLVEVGVAGILGLLEIVFGVIFGMVFFREHLGMIAMAGMTLIIIAAAIPYVKELKFNLEE